MGRVESRSLEDETNVHVHVHVDVFEEEHEEGEEEARIAREGFLVLCVT